MQIFFHAFQLMTVFYILTVIIEQMISLMEAVHQSDYNGDNVQKSKYVTVTIFCKFELFNNCVLKIEVCSYLLLHSLSPSKNHFVERKPEKLNFHSLFFNF